METAERSSDTQPTMDTGGGSARKIESLKVKGGQGDRGRITSEGSGQKTGEIDWHNLPVLHFFSTPTPFFFLPPSDTLHL